MVATLETAQKYKNEALGLYNDAQAKMDEYEGKDMPADVYADVNRLFAAGDQKSKLAELTQKGAEAQVWKELPNDLKRLETPGGNLVPEEGHETDWEKVMQKYGLRRWQIKDVKSSIASIDRAYKRSFDMLKDSGSVEVKAISNIAEGLTTSGSSLTPDIFVPEFVQKLYLMSHLRQAGSRIVPLKSDITRYPKMTTASNAAVLVVESSAATTTNATFGEAVFTAYMFRALQQASIEIVADAEFDLLSEIILPDMAQQFAAAENSYFTLGTGSGQPEGIAYGQSQLATASTTTSGFNFASAGTLTALTFDTLITLMHSLPPQYRTSKNVGWMMHDTIVAAVRKIKAVSAGTYIWEPSQQVGAPDTIYGKPVYYNQSMTSAVTTATAGAGNVLAMFGNFDYFWIGDRQGLDVRTASELYLANAQVGYFGFKRVDSHILQTDAFAAIRVTTA